MKKIIRFIAICSLLFAGCGKKSKITRIFTDDILSYGGASFGNNLSYILLYIMMETYFTLHI